MYAITGTSGTGKSALISALRNAGYRCYGEPIRRILEEQIQIDGEALPSKDPNLFLQTILSAFEQDYKDAALTQEVCFFDRGIPDAIAYAIRFGVEAVLIKNAAMQLRYSEPVFVLEPWSEIFVHDELRGKTFEEYNQFHELIVRAYSDLGYSLVYVPKESIESRVQFIKAHLNA
jgi:predicted ATPase